MNSTYIRSLDGIRALSALLVILFHWEFPLLQLKFGWIGVSVFFVMSGYLITSILVQTKTQSLGTYLQTFFYKRAVRIFPIYYLYLIVVLLMFWLLAQADVARHFETEISVMDDYQLLLFSYNFNFRALFDLAAGESSQFTRFFHHLWSLAVEEQFYLVFPFIVYFASRRLFKVLILIVILASPTLRLLSGEWLKLCSDDSLQIGKVIYKLPFFQADALAFGAALAVFKLERLRHYVTPLLLAVLILTLTVGVVNLLALQHYGTTVDWSSLSYDNPMYQLQRATPSFIVNSQYAYTYTLVNLCSFCLILCAIQRRAWLTCIENRFLAYLGKISYGIYLYHYGLLALLVTALPYFISESQIARNPLLELALFVGYLVTVILLAHLSYQFIERKIIRLKLTHLSVGGTQIVFQTNRTNSY